MSNDKPIIGKATNWTPSEAKPFEHTSLLFTANEQYLVEGTQKDRAEILKLQAERDELVDMVTALLKEGGYLSDMINSRECYSNIAFEYVRKSAQALLKQLEE